MSAARSLLLVLGIWPLLYLPGLGTLEIKGEEGRRILPAVTMLQSGNYLVPQVGSDPYFRKPPLVNWLVAASFKIFGQRNEWTARLPSALCVLVVALAFATVARRSLGAYGSLGGALIWLTNFGMLEKGRLIEIEALYVSLTGLAIICWLSWWQERRSPWLTWIVPFVFLGLGLLAKGPLLLVFFYAVVLGVLVCTRELRSIWNAPHVFGIFLMLAIFAAWAVPALRAMAASGGTDVAHVWTRQFSGRLSGEDFKLSGWLMNIPRGLGYFLPWTLLLPFVLRVKFSSARLESLANGILWGTGVSFLAVSLLPGSLARYSMPLLAPACWLVAMLLPSQPDRRRLRLPAMVAAVACFGIAVYAFALMPVLQKREKVRNIGAQLNAALSPNEPLYALDPDYQPFLFYVRDPIVYAAQLAEVPHGARYLLVQKEKEAEAAGSAQWAPRRAQPVLRVKDYRGKEVVMLEIGPGN